MIPVKNEVLVFDLDDTLYPERDFVSSGFRSVSRWLEEGLGKHGFFEIAWKHFERGRRGDIFDISLAELGVPVSPHLLESMIGVYRTHDPSINLTGQCRDVLRTLAGSFHIAILTDGFLITQQRKVRALGLDEMVELVVYTDAWGREFWKPSDRGFRVVEKFFGRESAAHTYIGDNPAKDFKAPNALGWRTIHLRGVGEYQAVQPAPGLDAQCAISSLDELLRLQMPVPALG